VAHFFLSRRASVTFSEEVLPALWLPFPHCLSDLRSESLCEKREGGKEVKKYINIHVYINGIVYMKY
jgi:hypothetical protein